jgi:hypothetical protein
MAARVRNRTKLHLGGAFSFLEPDDRRRVTGLWSDSQAMLRSTPSSPAPTPIARRAMLLGTLAGLLASRRSHAAVTVMAGTLLSEAERALHEGRPAAAAALFERASRIDDASATAELGMLRAWLQAGDYAHAVAWGRLVAGEHADAPEAAAWADAVEGLARPAATPPARAGVPPLPGPAAALPAAFDGPMQRLGCGLVDGARERLLVPPALAHVIAQGDLPWVVDGTGTTWRLRDADGALQREAAPSAEPAAASALPPARGALAHAGRPVLVMHPGATVREHAAAWPRLVPGLLLFPAAGERRLGIASPGAAAPLGSPVFDACGHWLGWVDDGRLEPATTAPEDVACPAGPAGDVSAVYGRWYPAAAVVWRSAA